MATEYRQNTSYNDIINEEDKPKEKEKNLLGIRSCLLDFAKNIIFRFRRTQRREWRGTRSRIKQG